VSKSLIFLLFFAENIFKVITSTPPASGTSTQATFFLASSSKADSFLFSILSRFDSFFPASFSFSEALANFFASSLLSATAASSLSFVSSSWSRCYVCYVSAKIAD
jgi:hypothetical protein